MNVNLTICTLCILLLACVCGGGGCGCVTGYLLVGFGESAFEIAALTDTSLQVLREFC